jgi:hypothetical protein
MVHFHSSDQTVELLQSYILLFCIMQVRSYPRRAFTSSEGDISFSDLGLTSKLEALFLEQITE